MTDHDDKVTRRYRELAREEPGAALDAAILAASHRAVARRSAASRWGPPLSIAAVLMLAVGITLNIQHEQPGVEYAEPSRPGAAPPAAKPVPEPAAPVPQAPASEPPPRSDAQPALRPKRAAPGAGRREEKFVQSPPPVEEKKDTALHDLAVARNESRTFSAPQGESAAPPPAAASAPAAPSRPATVAKTRDTAEMAQGAPAQAPAEPARAKSEADSMGMTRLRAQSAIADPAQELERIARLRVEGRHAEADKALEEFRRRHPGFRIPEAMWERVKPLPSSKGEGEMPPR
jgi:outer membrane biosynthesis protein TonB